LTLRLIGLRSKPLDRRDDDFLLVEPTAEPCRGALPGGSSIYAEGLRRAKAGRRARRERLHQERRDTAHAAYVAGARVMGAAVVTAAALAVLVFAGAFPTWPGASAGHRSETLERQSPGTATPASTPTTAPPSPSTIPEPSLDTATEVELPVVQPSDPAAIRGAPARRKIPARRSATDTSNAATSSNSTGAGELSSASVPPVSGAPAPTMTTTSTPNTNPAGHAPPGRGQE